MNIKGLTDYYIKKSISNKYNISTVRKAELIKALKDTHHSQSSTEIINPVLVDDMLYNELIHNADIFTLINLYKTNKKFREILNQMDILSVLDKKFNPEAIPANTFYNMIYHYFETLLINYRDYNTPTYFITEIETVQLLTYLLYYIK